MGSCHSRANTCDEDDARIKQQPSYTPSIIQAPGYTQDHNLSCRVLGQWTLDGEKARGYRYIIYVNNNNLLTTGQKMAQDFILEFIHELALVQGLRPQVKCLDYLSACEGDSDAEAAKQFYKDMLAAESRSELVKRWDKRPADVSPNANSGDSAQEEKTKDPQQQKVTLKSSEQEIAAVIARFRNSKDLDDMDAKSQIEPELIAALSRFSRTWPLGEFLKSKTQIFTNPPEVEAEAISKLQAQFYIQARAAYASFNTEEGSAPTVAINILPDEIPEAVFSNVQRYIEVTHIPLARLTNRSGKKSDHRQDRYTSQLLSLGTSIGTSGRQWQMLDDSMSGGMDTFDHTHIDIELLFQRGVSASCARKLMLGSVDANIDRSLKGKRGKLALYGDGYAGLTKAESDRCPCRKPRETVSVASPRSLLVDGTAATITDQSVGEQ